jgi:xylulokinase
MRSTSSQPVLGIDLGTSSVKVVALGADGRPLAEAVAAYDVTVPNGGWAEGDPDAWWQATAAATRECLRDVSPAPAAIGLSGQMHGVVLTGDAGRALRPAILWPDSRAAGEVAAYRRLPARQLRPLMNPLSPGMPGPMLLWLAAHEPGLFQHATWALQPKDWLRMRLTGIAAGDPSDASATLLYDVPADRWHFELIEALGLNPGLLPELLPSAGLAGTLTQVAADALGLAPGTPVVTGAADTAASIVGTGLVPGRVQMSIGTGIQIVTLHDKAVAADEPVTHLYRTAEDHGWYAMAAILSGGIALNWVRRLLGADWPELYASALRPGRPDDPLFLPHLVGERTPTSIRTCAARGSVSLSATTVRRCCAVRSKGSRSPRPRRSTRSVSPVSRAVRPVRPGRAEMRTRPCACPDAAPRRRAGGNCWRTRSGGPSSHRRAPTPPAPGRPCWRGGCSAGRADPNG